MGIKKPSEKSTKFNAPKFEAGRQSNSIVEATITLTKNKNINYSKIMALGTNNKYKRSAMRIREDNSSIAIHINADDVTALRASANAVLRDLQVITSTIKEFRKSTKSKGI